MADLTKEEIWKGAFAPRTWEAYKRSWRSFLTFIRLYQFAYPNTPINLDQDLLMDYGVWRFKNDGISKGTLKGDITGINCFLSYYYNYKIPTGVGKADKLIQFYRGMERWRKKLGLGKKTYPRRALVDGILHPMLDHVPKDTDWGKVIRALLLYAKQCGFRCHNYVYTKTGGISKMKVLHFNMRTKEDPDGFIIRLPYTKTKQEYDPGHETRTIHCRCHTVGRDYCAVHALWDICKDRLDHKEEALFLLPDGFPVTYNVLRKILKILCDAVGIDHRYYPTHSLRIGEATDQSMRGRPIELIMKFIQWKSRESAMIYIRPDNVDFIKFGIINSS